MHGYRAAWKSNKLKELWGKRPFGGCGYNVSKWAKTVCHRKERRIAEREIRQELGCG